MKNRCMYAHSVRSKLLRFGQPRAARWTQRGVRSDTVDNQQALELPGRCTMYCMYIKQPVLSGHAREIVNEDDECLFTLLP